MKKRIVSLVLLLCLLLTLSPVQAFAAEDSVTEKAAPEATAEEPAVRVIAAETETISETEEPDAGTDTLTLTVKGNVVSWNSYTGAAKYQLGYSYTTASGGTASNLITTEALSYDLIESLPWLSSRSVRVYVKAVDRNDNTVCYSDNVTVQYSNPNTLITKTEIHVTAPAVGASDSDGTFYMYLYSGTNGNVKYTGEYTYKASWHEILSSGGYSGWVTHEFEESTAYKLKVDITLPDGVFMDSDYDGVQGRATVNGKSTKMINVSWLSSYSVAYDFPALPMGISEAAITITAPRTGEKPSYSPTIPQNVNGDYTSGHYKNDIIWYDCTAKKYLTPDQDAFQSGHAYRVRVNLLAEDGYQFSAKATGTINGNPAEFTNYPSGMVNTDGVPVGAFEYIFPALDIPVITEQPKYAKTGDGMTASFSVTAEGSDLRYQWQVKKAGEDEWENVPENGNSATYSFTAHYSDHFSYYRCEISNPATDICGEPVYTESRWLAVYEKPVFTSQSGSVSASAGNKAIFTASVTGNDVYIRWEQSHDGGKTWNEVTSVDYATYTSSWDPTTLTVTVSAALAGMYFRCKAFNAAGPVYTNPVFLTVTGLKAGWQKAESRWLYYGSDGYPIKGWKQLGGKWYFFDSSGVMSTGWKQIGGKWYYFESGGSMITGWKQLGSKWYFFESDGAMVTGWKQIGGKWYYFESGGSMITGWKQLGSKWYFFESDGTMVTGWKQIGSKWYYFESSGVMLTGWQKFSNKWYYFESSGAMVTGLKQIGGKWYYFESSGAMYVTAGWKQIGSKWYFFDSSGVAQTGWKQIGGKWYYFDSNAAMVTGWQKISNKWYYFESSGVMHTGWLKLSSKWFWFDSNGVMAADCTITIGGKSYSFDINGVCINP